jgi:hypothetical protein
VGPACQWQCRAAPSRDWLPWAALSEHARGSLNTLPTAPRLPPSRQPCAARPHASPLMPPPQQPLASPLAPPSRLRASRPPWSEAAVARTIAVPPRQPRRSPVAVVPRRCPRAGEPPRFLDRLSCASGAPPLGRRALRHRARRVHALRRSRPSGPRTQAAPAPRAWAEPVWSWATRALCNWAERSCGPVALGLDFIFSEYIQFLANSKICVGFI